MSDVKWTNEQMQAIEEKGKKQVIIHEIPFEVNKALLVKKISDIIYDKKIEGLVEIRDESDREEKVRIAIDLKKDANTQNILNYLFKNTDLQINYSYNMVAIVNRRPMIVGVLDVIDAYIRHQKEVITRRTEFDLEHAKARMHILEGLRIALANIDEVIKTIRASKNKSDAIANLVKEYLFTEKQAEAIVNLQLYRLTNTDVDVLKEEYNNLLIIIRGLEEILADENKLKSVMKEELRKIKNEYATPRKTEIKAEVTEIKIDTEAMIPKEDCIVVTTKEGYVKRVSLRSYQASNGDATTLKDGDYILGTYEMNTMDTLLMFTDLGNYVYVPVYELPDLKWKDLGKHISNIVKVSSDENIISTLPITKFVKNRYITMASRDGMIKRTSLEEFKVQRYTKPITCMKLKNGDKMVTATIEDGNYVFVTTHGGYGLCYKTDEISVTGVRSSGVKSISLKNDYVVGTFLFNDINDYLGLITSKNTGKRVKLTEFELTSRGRKGVQVIRDVKTNPYYILNAFKLSSKHLLGLITIDDNIVVKSSELPIVDRYSTGTQLTKQQIEEAYIIFDIEKVEDLEEISEEKVEPIVSLQSVDERFMTIDDFLDNFDIDEK